eukprot:TRINITY_DN50270_c0_g1_i2.p1 TRINITY_DN50270_c0_g1~~TRINITY_DN50270_c0_g1_i2.p1  ORF type:complete len:1091 (+),score=214.28 TRINITY_DN50270_c0_g1_i2:419-3274(+)
MESGLPAWYTGLFLISNFCSVGYLVFATWLAMHASIAAHSIGTRLRTSFARLSIPHKEEVNAVRLRIFPALQRFLTIGKKVLKPGATAEEPPRRLPVQEEEQDAVDSEASSDLGEEEEAGGKSALDEEDDEHFRKYLEEQPRWLSYDAYSRACMSLGFNQMLQALAYYILGVVYNTSPINAWLSFAALKLLGCLLLALEVSGADNRKDIGAFLLLNVLPPLLAAMLLWTPANDPHLYYDKNLRIVATIVFWLHGGWLLYMMHQLQKGPQTWQASHQSKLVLPTRIRTVGYLAVLPLEQRAMVDSLHAEVTDVFVNEIRDVLTKLSQKTTDIIRSKSQLGEEPDIFQDAEVAEMFSTLQTRLDSFDVCPTFLRTKDLNEELKQAQAALDHLAILARARDLKTVVKALRHEALQDALSEDQRQVIEESYKEVLRKFKKRSERIYGLQRKKSSPFGMLQDCHEALCLLPGSSKDLSNALDLPQSLWSGGDSTPSKSLDPPLSGARTPTPSAMALDPRGTVRQQQGPPAHSSDDAPGKQSVGTPAAAEGRGPPDTGSAPMEVAVHEAGQPDEPQKLWLPPEATPSDILPSRVVRIFTLVCAIWWFVAGAAGAVSQYFWRLNPYDEEYTDELEFPIHWLEPPPFTHAVAMQNAGGDDQQQIIMSSHYETYQVIPAFGKNKTAEVTVVDGEGGAKARVVGFDGSAYVVSSMTPTPDGGNWTIKPLFDIPIKDVEVAGSGFSSFSLATGPSAGGRQSRLEALLQTVWPMPRLYNYREKLHELSGEAGRQQQSSSSTCSSATSSRHWFTQKLNDLVSEREAKAQNFSYDEQVVSAAQASGPSAGRRLSTRTEQAHRVAVAGNATNHKLLAMQLSQSDGGQFIALLFKGGMLDIWDLQNPNAGHSRWQFVRHGLWYFDKKTDYFSSFYYDGSRFVFARPSRNGPSLRTWSESFPPQDLGR